MTTETTEPTWTTEVCWIMFPDGTGTTDIGYLPCDVFTWPGRIGQVPGCCPSTEPAPPAYDTSGERPAPVPTTTTVASIGEPAALALPETGAAAVVGASILGTIAVVLGVLTCRVARRRP